MTKVKLKMQMVSNIYTHEWTNIPMFFQCWLNPPGWCPEC